MDDFVKLMKSWILYATKVDPEQLGLNEDQIVALGHGLTENRLINPPTPSSYETKVKAWRCVQCGKVFTREYRTRQYLYCSASCKNKAYRARKSISDSLTR